MDDNEDMNKKIGIIVGIFLLFSLFSGIFVFAEAFNSLPDKEIGDYIADDAANVSTGRTVPNSLKEKLAMEQVKSNPQGVTPPRMEGMMNDAKNNLFHADGWVKRVQNVNGVEIHYVENINTGQLIDFKFAGGN